jgi:hypothetical protein
MPCLPPFTSCEKREELAVTRFSTAGRDVTATLYSEAFLNPDGIVRRIIVLEETGKGRSEWEIHTAHYSDSVHHKVLEGDSHPFLIAEDSTGYSVWNVYSRQVVAESGIGDNRTGGESGTAKDDMVHAAISKEQWVKVLGLKPAENLKLTDITWQ